LLVGLTSKPRSNPEVSQTEVKIPSEVKQFRARHDVGGRREAPRRGASGDENARQVTKCRHSADAQQSGGGGLGQTAASQDTNGTWQTGSRGRRTKHDEHQRNRYECCV
jgi:hypothetical protein